MESIYLIRHTTPAVAKGICYGQTDLDVTESFADEAAVIRQHLPAGIVSVYSSPLQRCARLARLLFPDLTPHLMDDLMEVDCGQWEMRGWDELPREEIDPWMTDFVQVRIPGGESYLDLHRRVTQSWEKIRRIKAAGDAAVVAHGGVIRSILSGISGTPLIDSFKVFSLHYGCVIRIFEEGDRPSYEILSNQAPVEREQHKPSGFYK
jgi:alpha-ribazole phosphatase